MRPTSTPRLFAMNMKMYFDHDRSMRWCRQLADEVADHVALREGLAELVVLPPFPSIPGAVEIFAGTPIAVGAQDVSHAQHGPHTGEVNAATLRELGCSYVAVGHQERRQLNAEEVARVPAKVRVASAADLTPIICVGEIVETRPGVAAEMCLASLSEVIEGWPARASLVIAYEPVWAIGADRPAPADYVRDVILRIRFELNDRYQMKGVKLIYGGSAGPGLLRQLGPEADGLFLGRFAHDVSAVSRVLSETLATGAVVHGE